MKKIVLFLGMATNTLWLQASEKLVEKVYKDDVTINKKLNTSINGLEDQLDALKNKTTDKECKEYAEKVASLKQKIAKLVPDLTNEQKYFYFKRAVCFKQYDMVKFWIEDRGLDVNAKFSFCNGHGKTALHFAAENGETSIVQLLLKHKNIKINLQDSNGDTPLHCIAKRAPVSHESYLPSYNEITEMLLAAKADIGLPNRRGETSFEIARDGITLTQSMYLYPKPEIKRAPSVRKQIEALTL